MSASAMGDSQPVTSHNVKGRKVRNTIRNPALISIHKLIVSSIALMMVGCSSHQYFEAPQDALTSHIHRHNQEASWHLREVWRVYDCGMQVF